MAREFARRFYASRKWLACRATYIAAREAIDGGMCETCHEQPGFVVHHKIWLTPENINDQDIALSLDNLQYDCLICHNKERLSDDPDRCFFDTQGQPVPHSPP